MNQQFSQTYCRSHIIKAKVQALKDRAETSAMESCSPPRRAILIVSAMGPLSLQLVACIVGSLSLQLVASATLDLCCLSWLLPPLCCIKILNRLRQNTIPCVSETLRPPTSPHYTSSEDLAAYVKGSDPTSPRRP